MRYISFQFFVELMVATTIAGIVLLEPQLIFIPPVLIYFGYLMSEKITVVNSNKTTVCPPFDQCPPSPYSEESIKEFNKDEAIQAIKRVGEKSRKMYNNTISQEVKTQEKYKTEKK